MHFGVLVVGGLLDKHAATTSESNLDNAARRFRSLATVRTADELSHCTVGPSRAFQAQNGRTCRNYTMKALVLAAVAVAFTASSLSADDIVSFEEAKSIQAALNAIDCYGGEMERETNGAVAFEVEDVVCADGQYDFKLDKSFGVVSKERS